MIPVFNNLLNSGSKVMAVNGSVTPKVFSFSPSVNSGVLGLMCVFRDEGTTSLDKFGAITALSNGLLVKVTINSVDTTIATIKDNAELCSRFHFNQFGNGAILSLLGIATPEGFGASNNLFIGYMEFSYPNFMVLTSNDSISVTIRDDLTSISLLEIAVKTIID